MSTTPVASRRHSAPSRSACTADALVSRYGPNLGRLLAQLRGLVAAAGGQAEVRRRIAAAYRVQLSRQHLSAKLGSRPGARGPDWHLVEQIIGCCLPPETSTVTREQVLQQAAGRWAAHRGQRPPGYTGPLPDGAVQADPMADELRHAQKELTTAQALNAALRDDLAETILRLSDARTEIKGVRVEREKFADQTRRLLAQMSAHITQTDQTREAMRLLVERYALTTAELEARTPPQPYDGLDTGLVIGQLDTAADARRRALARYLTSHLEYAADITDLHRLADQVDVSASMLRATLTARTPVDRDVITRVAGIVGADQTTVLQLAIDAEEEDRRARDEFDEVVNGLTWHDQASPAGDITSTGPAAGSATVTPSASWRTPTPLPADERPTVELPAVRVDATVPQAGDNPSAPADIQSAATDNPPTWPMTNRTSRNRAPSRPPSATCRAASRPMPPSPQPQPLHRVGHPPTPPWYTRLAVVLATLLLLSRSSAVQANSPLPAETAIVPVLTLAGWQTRNRHRGRHRQTRTRRPGPSRPNNSRR